MTLPLPGDRIRLVAMPDDPDPIEPGTQGTVRGITHVSDGHYGFVQVDVAWDNGRQLMLTVPPDRFEITKE